MVRSATRSGALHSAAGRERLIYALSQRVENLLATDLYNQASTWVGARTDSPKAFVLAGAPFTVDPDRIDAAYMNMRNIDYAGEPVDFCYSYCAFEHIGTEDEHFLQHLRGAHGILKPGGIYVLTTELRYGPTLPVPHNFFFSLDHLIDLAMQSGFTMDPVFDARLSQHTMNAPNIDGKEFGIAAAKLWQPSVTPWRQGVVFTSVLLVLRKLGTPVRPVVLGYNETKEWIESQTRRLNTELWKTWQAIAPDTLSRTPAIGHDEFVSWDGVPVPFLHTAWLGFGNSRVGLKIVPPDDSSARPGHPVTLRISSRPIGGRVDPQPVLSMTTEGQDITGEFLAEPGKVYAVIASGPAQPVRTWGVFARHL